MFRLFSKLMNGIVSMLDKVNCGLSCCSNTIHITVPLVCSDCSRRSMASDMSNSSSELHVEGREVSPSRLSHPQ